MSVDNTDEINIPIETECPICGHAFTIDPPDVDEPGQDGGNIDPDPQQVAESFTAAVRRFKTE
jgi:hypothetical protein